MGEGNQKGFFENVVNKAQSIVSTFSEMMKKGVTLQEIVDMVKNHENAKKVSKTLLGITYDFYQLELQGLSFQLEIRQGVIERILYLKVYTKDQVVFHYRSYQGDLTLEDQIKAEHLPEIVKGNKYIL